MNNNISVRAAKYEDIAAMIEICRQNLVSTNSHKFTAEDFAKKGFLITALTEETAKNYIDDIENFVVLVALSNQEIVGYTVACNLEASQIVFPRDVQKNFANKVIYHKQIATNSSFKGVGSKLLQQLFIEAKLRQFQQIICRIVHKPFFNQNSISFHQKNGFELIASMSQNSEIEEEKLFGIYSKTV